ncbi:UNVERIFIED_CONTAM: hypothetical protein K2H54_014355 [Gekko kuhli]
MRVGRRRPGEKTAASQTWLRDAQHRQTRPKIKARTAPSFQPSMYRAIFKWGRNNTGGFTAGQVGLGAPCNSSEETMHMLWLFWDGAILKPRVEGQDAWRSPVGRASPECQAIESAIVSCSILSKRRQVPRADMPRKSLGFQTTRPGFGSGFVRSRAEMPLKAFPCP